jgi:hypothetical protein
VGVCQTVDSAGEARRWQATGIRTTVATWAQDDGFPTEIVDLALAHKERSATRRACTIAWLNRCRRLAKDWENLNRNALAFLKRLMLRKLFNP